MKRVLQERKGFKDGSYLGDPNHLFARYNFSSGRNVRAGITMEKDPGEKFFSGNNKNGLLPRPGNTSSAPTCQISV